MSEWGDPVSYMAVERGVPVLAADGSQFATVERVLAVPAKDVFDGIVVKAGEATRFVDRDQIGEIYERAVVTTLTAEQASSLPAPDPGSPVYVTDPSEGAGTGFGAWWRRTFGNLGWRRTRNP